MGAGRKTISIAVEEKSERGWRTNGSVSARNLRKADLGGIIFGCQHSTMKECIEKNLFGLPSSHFSYVMNATPGLPLFLFNYSDRKLHGVFEAASLGQLHIDPHAWTQDATNYTPFPAQVRVRVLNRCRPLLEQAFSPIISDNYYSTHHFWFELDPTQTTKLLSLFELSPFPLSPPIEVREKTCPQGEFSYAPGNTNLWSSLFKAEQALKLPMSYHCDSQLQDVCSNKDDAEDDDAKDRYKVKEQPCDIESLINQLLKENEKLKGSELENNIKICSLEQQLVDSQVENQDLRKQYELSAHFEEAYHNPFPQPQSDDNIFIIGGYDGCRLLSDFSQYSLRDDLVQSLKPMTFVRSNTSVAILNSELYLFGGVNANSWYNTVESYNLTRKTWVVRPPLNQKKGSLAGLSVSDKLYAIGGGNGIDCFAEVEMFDAGYGRWIFTKSMQHKRFTPGVVSMNGVIYAVGGYDGEKYLKSVERFDPREPRWTELNNMTAARGCHSLAACNEKLYALGGYDGQEIVSNVEIFDPRACSWVMGEPMKYPRVYSAAVVIGGRIYTIGGLDDNTILDSIEYYTEGYGWTMTNLKALGKRSSFSALVV